MPRITRSALLPFSVEQMFELVNDVKSYPLFLPSCSGSRVLEISENEMTASIEVAKGGIRKTFTTRNELIVGEAIKMKLVEGPFRRLEGGWYFTRLDSQACKIELNLDFEFTNAVVEMVFGRVFNELAGNMVKAFAERAKDVYDR